MKDVTEQLTNLDLSKLHFYSYGYVIEDNLDNESEIKIFPVEKLYTKGGDLNDSIKNDNIINKERNLVSDSDKDEIPVYTDNEEMFNLEETTYLYCKWSGISDSNRITPPNVCKGETVIIYRFSNRDEYYWDTYNTDLRLRKEEHVVFTFSDKPNLDEEEDSIEDRYTITFSPKTKTISLHTTDKYGEYTTYDFNLKTEDGYIQLIDGKKNELMWDSTKDKVSLHIEGTKNQYDLTVHGDDGFISIEDDKKNKLLWDSTKDTVSLHVEGSKNQYDTIINGDDGFFTLTDDKSNSIFLNSGSDKLTTNINKNIEANTETFTVNCKTFNVNSTNFNIATSSYDLKSSSNTITSSSTDYKGGYIKHDGISIDKIHLHTGNLGFNTSPPNN